MSTVLDVQNLGKCYLLGERVAPVHRTLKELLEGFVKPKKEIIETRELWALKDINFSVEQGDVVGIIGKNGSGKSTLLRVIARVTNPTEGDVYLNGRVGSYLGIGAGIHPELTGRENIFVSGTVLGMRKRMIEKHLDEIIAFSELARFIDTPVKYYSSGMQARLAFSVAAFLDHGDILLIDEALAAGDISFCAKCMTRIRSMVQQGQTALFASHSIDQVRELTTHCLYLKEGRLEAFGPTPEVMKQYIADIEEEMTEGKINAAISEKVAVA